MFICEKCRVQSKKGETPERVVVEVRSKLYPPHQDHQRSTKTTVGYEIVREMMICKPCANEITTP